MKAQTIAVVKTNRFTAGKLFSKYGIYIALAALIIILSIMAPVFMTSRNWINILLQISVIGIIAVGMTFVIITGGIDLSVGSVLAYASVFATSYATKTVPFPLWVPIVLGLVIGLVCGAANGIIIARLKVPPFITTLATMTIARGLALLYTNGAPVIKIADNFGVLGSGTIGPIPIPVIIFICVIVFSIFLLNFTKFGRHTFAVGGNEQTAIVSGINVVWVKFMVYAISGVCTGLAALVLSARTMTGQPASGVGYELNAIAAVVIGGSSLSGGVGSIFGTVIGMLIIGILTNGLQIMNVSSYIQNIVQGVIIIVAVLMDRRRID